MNRARFVALMTMAYEVVRDNSAWMLAQKARAGSRMAEMKKDVREKNKQQWDVVKLHLQDAMGDLQTKHKARIGETQVRAVTTESTTTEELLARIKAFIHLFLVELKDVTISQDLYRSWYMEADSVVGAILTWGVQLNSVFKKYYKGSKAADTRVLLFSKYIGPNYLDRPVLVNSVTLQTERVKVEDTTKAHTALREKDVEGQWFQVAEITAFTYEMIRACIAWNLFGMADNWINYATEIDSNIAGLTGASKSTDLATLRDVLKRGGGAQPFSLMTQPSTAWHGYFGAGAYELMVQELFRQKVDLSFLERLTADQREAIDVERYYESQEHEKEKEKKEKKMVVWLAALASVYL